MVTTGLAMVVDEDGGVNGSIICVSDCDVDCEGD